MQTLVRKFFVLTVLCVMPMAAHAAFVIPPASDIISDLFYLAAAFFILTGLWRITIGQLSSKRTSAKDALIRIIIGIILASLPFAGTKIYVYIPHGQNAPPVESNPIY